MAQEEARSISMEEASPSMLEAAKNSLSELCFFGMAWGKHKIQELFDPYYLRRSHKNGR